LIKRDEKLIENMTTEKVIKMREREIKNTKIYTGSPFFKGYVQSFANKQKILLKINKINSIQSQLHLLKAKNPLHTTTHSPLHATTGENSVEPYCTNPNYKPYAIWKPNSQLQIKNPM